LNEVILTEGCYNSTAAALSVDGSDHKLLRWNLGVLTPGHLTSLLLF